MKILRYEDMKMWRCGDVEMRRYSDIGM